MNSRRITIAVGLSLLAVIMSSLPNASAYTWTFPSSPFPYHFGPPGSGSRTIPIPVNDGSGSGSITVGFQSISTLTYPYGCSGSASITGYSTHKFTGPNQTYNLTETLSIYKTAGCDIYVATSLYDQSNGNLIATCGNPSNPVSKACYNITL